MSNITVTYRDGRVAQLEQVYIRGSKIRFLILPDMLKNAPMLKSMKNKNQGSGAGRGKAAILKAQGERAPPRAVRGSGAGASSPAGAPRRSQPRQAKGRGRPGQRGPSAAPPPLRRASFGECGGVFRGRPPLRFAPRTPNI